MVKTDYSKRERPYSKPTLTVYGKVQELTKTVATVGQPDGGVPTRNFTSA
jgi:hypothetical protein